MVSIPIVETVVNLILYVMGVSGLVGLALLMVVESFGIPPLPSEVILPFAGFLVASGVYSFPAAYLAAMAGALAGSLVAYSVGRWGRRWLARSSGTLRLDPRHLDEMDQFFQRHGESTVAIARLVPVVRSYISYPAGTARMSPVLFSIYTLIGATPFTIALIYLGFVLRSRWELIVQYFRFVDYVAVAAIVILLVYLLLRWRGILGPGFPPKLVKKSSPTRPTAVEPPRATDR